MAINYVIIAKGLSIALSYIASLLVLSFLCKQYRLVDTNCHLYFGTGDYDSKNSNYTIVARMCTFTSEERNILASGRTLTNIQNRSITCYPGVYTGTGALDNIWLNLIDGEYDDQYGDENNYQGSLIGNEATITGLLIAGIALAALCVHIVVFAKLFLLVQPNYYKEKYSFNIKIATFVFMFSPYFFTCYNLFLTNYNYDNNCEYTHPGGLVLSPIQRQQLAQYGMYYLLCL